MYVQLQNVGQDCRQQGFAANCETCTFFAYCKDSMQAWYLYMQLWEDYAERM